PAIGFPNIGDEEFNRRIPAGDCPRPANEIHRLLGSLGQVDAEIARHPVPHDGFVSSRVEQTIADQETPRPDDPEGTDRPVADLPPAEGRSRAGNPGGEIGELHASGPPPTCPARSVSSSGGT